jgi:hypothetical protein
MNVTFSCVVDKPPRFGRQAFVWASSLLTYGGADVASLAIHTVGDPPTSYKTILKDWGIRLQAVPNFDRRHPNSNKLAQLESEILQESEYVIFCDCDLAFCGDISRWIAGDTIRGRIASSAGLPLDRWTAVFEAAALGVPHSTVATPVTGTQTLPSYVNGGFYILPQAVFRKLRETWPKWNRWLLERQDLIDPFAEFTDQISFAMSCEELSLKVDHLPMEANFDTVYLPKTLDSKFVPAVLHYHRLSAEGILRTTGVPLVDKQIRKINDLIRLAERVNFDLSSLLLLRERCTA